MKKRLFYETLYAIRKSKIRVTIHEIRDTDVIDQLVNHITTLSYAIPHLAIFLSLLS